MNTAACLFRFTAAVALANVLFFAMPVTAQLNCNAGVEYYPDGGGIKRCELNGYHTIYTARGFRVTCADGKPLEQYPNGAVRRCSIESPHEFEGTRCEAPSVVEFDPDGRLEACRRS